MRGCARITRYTLIHMSHVCLIHTCDPSTCVQHMWMSHTCEWGTRATCEWAAHIWLRLVVDVKESHVWMSHMQMRDSFTCHTCDSIIFFWHASHDEAQGACEWATCVVDTHVGLMHTSVTRVGSFKLYVSFAKEPYKRDYIMQKRPHPHAW